MARKGRMDRGLLSKPDSAGKVMWHVRLYHEGKERRFGSFPNKTKAREFYEKAKLEQKEGRFFPERFQRGGYEMAETVLDRYLDMIHTKKPTTQADYRFLGRWWKERLKGKRVNHITPALFEEIKRELTAKAYTPETVAHYFRLLRQALYAVIGKSKLPENPFEKFKLPKIKPTRTRFLALEEEKTLLEKLGPTYGPWARLAILTGLRKSEQFNAQWRDVDLDVGILTLPETKSGGVQYVHLNEEAKAILRQIQVGQMERGEFGRWVFPSKQPGSPLGVHNFYGRIFLPAVEKAKLEGVTWHTLRHTFASRLAMGGQNASTIAELLRHSGIDLVKRYAHLSPSHLKTAVEGLSGFGKKEPTPAETEGGNGTVATGTVTKTGSGEREKSENPSEVVEVIGRGERI